MTGLPRVLRPRAPAIVAVGEVLGLLAVAVPRVDGHEARPVVAFGAQNPLVLFQSTTALPEKIMTPSSSRKATGRCCQCTMSG